MKNEMKRSHLAGMKSSLPNIQKFKQMHLCGTRILSEWVRGHRSAISMNVPAGRLRNFPTDCVVKQKPHHARLFLHRSEDPLKVVSIPSIIQDASVGFFQRLGVRL